ncbi:MAG: hypothetical protein A2252_06710 [Elusimicrobia bacterium RIFOXYA2_FULL_39_19]|nr:MAG: hypothetical protein A2252_06710 [Elusimicrobia bacterium RIFOXYA2_FULL_39_19]
MKKTKRTSLLLVLLLSFFSLFFVGNVNAEKLRYIVETDAGGDPDDEASLVRFMLYLNDIELEGMIATRPETREDNTNPQRTGLDICRSYLNAYGEVYDKLKENDPEYPTKQYLWDRTVAGYDNTDDGVNLIISIVDKDDPRPVWFSNWGTDDGTISSLKRALDKVLAERGPEGYAVFKNKINLCSDMTYPDNKFGGHTGKIKPDWLITIDTKLPDMDCGTWYWRFKPLTYKAGGFDIDADVKTNHGPLGPLYTIQKEGDTCEFLYVLPTGLSDVNHPEWGCWAGRYGVNETYNNPNWYWINQRDRWERTISRDNTLLRWAVHIQNDFKARMDWCVKSYKECNHEPVVVCQDNKTTDVLYENIKSGEDVTLSAKGTMDPDGNKLIYSWYVYPEPSSYQGEVSISNADKQECKVSIPQDAGEKNIHIILAVTDDGSPALTRYRRVIVQAN